MPIKMLFMNTKSLFYFLLFAIIIGSISAQIKQNQKDATFVKSATDLQNNKVNPDIKDKTDTLKIKVNDLGQEKILLNASQKFKLFKINAHASYYHDKFNGRKTASGKRFDNNGYTAAHKKLPFGTKLKVTNEANGKFVIVEVNDRGPFSKGRELDLTKKAFLEITNNINMGVVVVKIELINSK